jgi:hypothetical protein
LLAIADGGQGMQIGDEIKRLFVPLQGNVLPDGSEVIAPVETPCGLNARKNTHDLLDEEPEKPLNAELAG